MAKLAELEKKLLHYTGKAIADFNMAIKLQPNDEDAWLNKGIAENNLYMHDQACEDWRTAVKYGSQKAMQFIASYCGK